jgi:predicted ABC-type ATPase
VPEDKIESCYQRSLGFLMEAIRHTNRAYIFDNSKENSDSILIAEITEGKNIVLEFDPMPAWFKHTVWDKSKLLTT